MADWGLQAANMPKECVDHDHHHNQHQHQHQNLDHHDLFGSIDIEKEHDQALLFCFPDLYDDHHHDHDHRGATSVSMDTIVTNHELDQLYKPFYEVPAASSAVNQTFHHQLNYNSNQEIQQDNKQEIKNLRGSTPKTSQLASKLKKRKNQQKRVVVQVSADGLSSDPWSWRKYGQKPIKGSIYPRSYYRCSSSKGCMARRQVEQSCIDSSIYTLTYTADHNHPQPTRRNSLAGINRSRFKATPKSPTTTSSDGDHKTVTMLPKDSLFHSPPTLSVSSIEDEVLQQSNIKQEIDQETFYNKFENQGHIMMPGINDDEYMFFSDDFFEGL